MATKHEFYIHSKSFFDGDRWAAHDKIGELLANGITQITVAKEGDAYTVSWPVPDRLPAVIPPPEAAA